MQLILSNLAIIIFIDRLERIIEGEARSADQLLSDHLSLLLYLHVCHPQIAVHQEGLISKGIQECTLPLACLEFIRLIGVCGAEGRREF